MAADTNQLAAALLDATEHPAGTLAELEQLVEVLNRAPLAKQILVDAGGREAADRNRRVRRVLGGFSPLSQELAELVAEQRALDQLPQLTARFAHLLKQQAGAVQVTVETPQKLSAEVRDELATQYSRDGHAPVITEVVKPELLGGLRVIVNDEVIDHSVAGSLDQLTTQLLHG